MGEEKEQLFAASAGLGWAERRFWLLSAGEPESVWEGLGRFSLGQACVCGALWWLNWRCLAPLLLCGSHKAQFWPTAVPSFQRRPVRDHWAFLQV